MTSPATLVSVLAGRDSWPPLRTPGDGPQPHSTDTLMAMAEELASALAGVELSIPPEEQRGFVRLTLTHSHEAWLIVWKPTSALRLHDHGGSAGAISIASGTLAESYLDLGQAGRVRRRRLHAGATVEVPATRIHQVRNEGPERAVSVHVYSPPLAAMTFYDSARRQRSAGSAQRREAAACEPVHE